MWPMIAGLGPIFGEGIIGWIVYNNRDYEREYRDGAALSLDEPFARVAVPYTLIRPLAESRSPDRGHDEQRRRSNHRVLQESA